MIKLIATLATATAFSLSASFAAFAKDDKAAAGVTRKEVLATSTNMVDAPIAFPAKAGKVTAEMVTFEAEGHTALHQHPVPSFVYVLEGELEVRVKGKEPKRYTPGQAFVEAQDTDMQAFNVSTGPTKILVVYSGTEGGPNSVAIK